MESKLILIRHGQSLWNKENRFTGLTDIELSDKGIDEANKASNKINEININIDMVFTSELKRAIKTSEIILNNLSNKLSKESIKSNSALNERDYGDLTGKNKEEITKEYGIDCVHKWRRGFYNTPPGGENLDEVCKRVSRYYNKEIKENLKNKNILVSAHGNSLRALFVILGIFSEKEIERVEIPTGNPYVITFKNNKIVNNGYLCPIKLKGRQILDSRGNPTLEVDVLHQNSLISRESCPSGASTGSNEAKELRDNGKLYLGKSVNNAIKNVGKFTSSLNLEKEDIIDLKTFDKKLCNFDGTELKKILEVIPQQQYLFLLQMQVPNY